MCGRCDDPAPQTKRSTAYHEAGHAVIARVLTMSAGRATIRPNYRDREAGHAILHDVYLTMSEWEKRGKVREPDAAWHGRIIAVMAGAQTEAVLLGRKSLGDDDDRYWIERMAEELRYSPPWQRLEPRPRAMTRTLVRRHRALIERTARALLKNTSLGAKLGKLIGRSVADVKVNAPLLLAMSQQADVPR
jgi:hypothetical protein